MWAIHYYSWSCHSWVAVSGTVLWTATAEAGFFICLPAATSGLRLSCCTTFTGSTWIAWAKKHQLRWPVVCHQQKGLWLHQISMVHLNIPQPPKLADREGHQTSSHEHPQKLGPPLCFLLLHWNQPMAQTHYLALWRKGNWKLDRNWRRGILKEREETTL